jgi:Fe2+ transport system protein FeoA
MLMQPHVERDVSVMSEAVEESAAFPLLLAGAGEMVEIAAITAGEALRRKLQHLGLRPGVCVRISQHTPAGVVIATHGMRLALGKATAQQVLARPCPGKAQS